MQDLDIRWLSEQPLAQRTTLDRVRIRAGVALGLLFLDGPLAAFGRVTGLNRELSATRDELGGSVCAMLVISQDQPATARCA